MEIKLDEPWITGPIRCQKGYAYTDSPFWNVDKQLADHKREYIGKYDGSVITPDKNSIALRLNTRTVSSRPSPDLYRPITV